MHEAPTGVSLKDWLEAKTMDIQLLPDDSDNWLPGYCSDDLPQFFLTPDRKILKSSFLAG